jgi:hypothetical protein
MKVNAFDVLLIVSALGAAGAAAQTPVPVPQPPTERTGSPYDQNPACRDREVASTDPACIIKDGPSVYRFGFDGTTPQPVAPAQANPAPPATTVVPPQTGTPSQPY